MNTSCLDIYWNNDISIKHIIIHVYMYHVYIYIHITWSRYQFPGLTGQPVGPENRFLVESPLGRGGRSSLDLDGNCSEWQGEYPQIWNFIDTFWKTEWSGYYYLAKMVLWWIYALLKHVQSFTVTRETHDAWNIQLPANYTNCLFSKRQIIFFLCGSIF